MARITWTSSDLQTKAKIFLNEFKTKISYGHSSNSNDRTRDKCVPRFRCNDAQSMQINAPRFNEAHVGFSWSQSAQRPLPATCFIDWTDAGSAIVVPPFFAARAAFEDSMFCRLYRICCSIDWTHSSRSSFDEASKNHCLSKETMVKTFSSPSSSLPLLFDWDFGVDGFTPGIPCGRRCRFFELGVSIFAESTADISLFPVRRAFRGLFEPGILIVVRWRMISLPWESFS